MKNTNITAKLIGESSGGFTAVQIYKNDTLVWSHEYFPNGASEYLYNIVMEYNVLDDMENCELYHEYEGCDRDENGEVIDYDTEKTTGVMLEYNNDTGFWTIGENLGQGWEAVDNLCVRLCDRAKDKGSITICNGVELHSKDNVLANQKADPELYNNNYEGYNFWVICDNGSIWGFNDISDLIDILK